MKQLNPDGSITIPSNLPRTRRGPDSRGIRLCFSELGRSCLLQQGYLIFTDGSAYVYDAPSNTEIEALCDSLIRGRVFNFSVRRSRGGFVKGFTPPGDYETIYSFPPYDGVAPIACGMGTDWASLVWTGSLANGHPGAVITGTGLNFSEVFAGGDINDSDVFSSSLQVKSDAAFLDVQLHNTGPDPLDAQFVQIAASTLVTFTGLAPGATDTQVLTLGQATGIFFMSIKGVPQPNSNALNWDCVLTPHL